jgi:hypothetical protein
MSSKPVVDRKVGQDLFLAVAALQAALVGFYWNNEVYYSDMAFLQVFWW